MSPLCCRCRCQRFGFTSVSDGRDNLAAEVLFLISLNGFDYCGFHCIPRSGNKHAGHILHLGIIKKCHAYISMTV